MTCAWGWKGGPLQVISLLTFSPSHSAQLCPFIFPAGLGYGSRSNVWGLPVQASATCPRWGILSGLAPGDSSTLLTDSGY